MDRAKAIDIQNRIVLKRALLVRMRKSVHEGGFVVLCDTKGLSEELPFVPANYCNILKLAIEDAVSEVSCWAQRVGKEIYIVVQIVN